MWFSVALVKFPDLGLIDMFSINLNAEVVACIFYHSENRATGQIWKILPNMVFPRFGGKNGGVLSMRMQVILDSSFACPVQPLYVAGRKESSGTGLSLREISYVMDAHASDHALICAR